MQPESENEFPAPRICNWDQSFPGPRIDGSAQTVPVSRIGDWIQTYTGRRFWPLDASPFEIDIMDIAHALSNQCRFAGHVNKFYSVAQHSVLVSEFCEPKDAMWGLLHDASEAYLVDVPKPIKVHAGMSEYRLAEIRLQSVICKKFGLACVMPDSVHNADRALLAAEARDLMSPLDDNWAKWLLECPPYFKRIRPWTPKKAKERFLSRFVSLTYADIETIL